MPANDIPEDASQPFRLRRRRAAVSAEEVLVWLRSRAGASWEATIRDIEHALDDICK